MKLNVVNFANEVVGDVELPADVFGIEAREDIIYKVIHWQLAKRRAGTHSTKERGDVSGSTRKIYRQKGTGGARHGGIRAAQFRTGGIIFGPHFRSHEYKINKKVRKLALRSMLSWKLRDGMLSIMESCALPSHKTSAISGVAGALNAKSVLFIDNGVDANFQKSCANLNSINVLHVDGINVYDIAKHDKVVITLGALDLINERLR